MMLSLWLTGLLALVIVASSTNIRLNPKGSQLALAIRGGSQDAKKLIKTKAPVVKTNSKAANINTIKTAPSSLMKVNILMLMFYSTLGAAMPYIPLYYRHIGIPDKDIGLLGAITPMVTFLVSPLWGALADSTGWHKQIMLLTFIGSVLVRCGLAVQMTHIVWLFAVVAISAVLNAPVKPLMDSAVMSMLADKSDYGRSRVFGQVGFGLGSYLVGPFVASNIRAIFYMQLFFAIPAAVLMAGFQPTPTKVPVAVKGKKAPSKEKLDVVAALRHTVADPKIAVFFFVVFVIGVSSGIIENFAYVRLSEIGGKKDNAVGICRLVSSIAGGPFFWLSGSISRRIGVNGVLGLTLLAFALRFFIYAAMVNPWQALPAEAMRGATFALFWASSCYYVYNASPPGLTATMLSILNAMYGGLGQSIGSLLGGWMSNHFGISRTFFLCGGVDVVCLALFVVYASSEARQSAISAGVSVIAGGRGNSNGKAGGRKGTTTVVGVTPAKQRKSTTVAATAAGGGGLSLIALFMLFKISLLFSPVALAWAMFF